MHRKPEDDVTRNDFQPTIIRNAMGSRTNQISLHWELSLDFTIQIYNEVIGTSDVCTFCCMKLLTNRCESATTDGRDVCVSN